jgi:hypothetical protein
MRHHVDAACCYSLARYKEESWCSACRAHQNPNFRQLLLLATMSVLCSHVGDPDPTLLDMCMLRPLWRSIARGVGLLQLLNAANVGAVGCCHKHMAMKQIKPAELRGWCT